MRENKEDKGTLEKPIIQNKEEHNGNLEKPVIENKEEENGTLDKPIIEETNNQPKTEVITPDVKEKNEERTGNPIDVEKMMTQTDPLAVHVPEKNREEEKQPTVQANPIEDEGTRCAKRWWA